MWIWQRNNNPHYQRLMRPWRKQAAGDTFDPGTSFGVLAGIVVNCCIIQGISSGFYSVDFYFLCAGILLGLMPLLTGLYAAWFTAQDTAKPDFELLTLTTLRNEQITWGYIHALSTRFRLVLGLQFGVLITFIVAGGFFILTTSLFYEFPVRQNPQQAHFTRFFLGTGLLLSVGYIGLYWLIGLLGVFAGLWWRQMERAVATTVILSVMLLGIWYSSAIQIVQSFSESTLDIHLSAARVGLSVVPVIGLGFLLSLSYRVVRRGSVC